MIIVIQKVQQLHQTMHQHNSQTSKTSLRHHYFAPSNLYVVFLRLRKHLLDMNPVVFLNTIEGVVVVLVVVVVVAIIKLYVVQTRRF